jgi:hypothetical protein
LQDAFENVPELLLDHVTVPVGAFGPDSWTVALQVVAESTTTLDREQVTPRSVTLKIAAGLLVPSPAVTV